MAPVYTPNTVQAELVQALHGQVLENTLAFECGKTPDGAEMAELATVLADWWTEMIAPYLSNELGLTRVDVRGLEAAASASYSYPVLPVVLGGVGDQALPSNCALCVSFRTALSGRSFRGRNYVAGVTEGNESGSTFAAANANGIATAYNALQAYVTANATSVQWVWVVVSTRSGNADRPSGVTTPVTSAILVDYFVDSQRRRLPGRGR